MGDRPFRKSVRFVAFKKTGEIIDDTPFFSSIIEGFEKECRRNGAEVLMTSLNQQTEDFKQQLKRLKEDTQAGMVILGTELEETDIALFDSFQNPIILLDYTDNLMRYASVSIWNEEAAEKAVFELVRNGHREIGYLRGAYRIKAFCEREEGFRKQLKKSELKYNPAYAVTLRTTMDGAMEDMSAYLDRRKKLPTAFFADNDMIALGAMKAIQKHGIQIPQDISLIGFDDLPFAENCIPGLTSLRVEKQEMGRTAAYKILNLMEGKEKTVSRIQTIAELVRRGSVRKLF